MKTIFFGFLSVSFLFMSPAIARESLSKKNQKEVKVSKLNQSKVPKIDQQKFFDLAGSEKTFPANVDGYKRESIIETNSDITENDRWRYQTQYATSYLKEKNNQNFYIKILVNNWSHDSTFMNMDLKIFPLEKDSNMELDPYQNPAQTRNYRADNYYVNELDSKVDYKPSMITFYFLNGINVQISSYQLESKQLNEFIKKTNFMNLAQLK